jgi:hypothetical protein
MGALEAYNPTTLHQPEPNYQGDRQHFKGSRICGIVRLLSYPETNIVEVD